MRWKWNLSMVDGSHQVYGCSEQEKIQYKIDETTIQKITTGR
jgi:hypothetical protein